MRQRFIGTCLTVCFLISIPSLLEAQIDTQFSDNTDPEIKGMVRHSVGHWLQPLFPSVQFGVDYRVGEGRYLRHEVGYVLKLDRNLEALVDADGLRFRTAYRKYFRIARLRHQLTYVEFSLDYNYLDALIKGDFTRANFSFQQRFNYSAWQHSFATNIHLGVSDNIGEHWRFDLGLGAGVRVNYRQFSDLPDDAVFSTNGELFLWGYEEGEGVGVTLNLPITAAVAYQW